MPRTCPSPCTPSPADPEPLSLSARLRRTRVSRRHSSPTPSALEKSLTFSSPHGLSLTSRYVNISFYLRNAVKRELLNVLRAFSLINLIFMLHKYLSK